MRLPFVSRLAFDLVCAERDQLRAQNAKLTDDLVRIQRVRQGMREIPRPQPKPQANGPIKIPPEVQELIDGFNSKAVRDGLERDAETMHRGGAPWTEVRAALERQLFAPMPQGDGDPG